MAFLQILKSVYHLNFKDFHKISILVCPYKPEYLISSIINQPDIRIYPNRPIPIINVWNLAIFTVENYLLHLRPSYVIIETAPIFLGKF